MGQTHANPYILVLAAVIIYKLIDLAVSYFFKRVTRDDYITKSDCAACKAKQTPDDLEAFKEEIRDCISEFRGILLVVAINGGMKPEELKELTKG